MAKFTAEGDMRFMSSYIDALEEGLSLGNAAATVFTPAMADQARRDPEAFRRKILAHPESVQLPDGSLAVVPRTEVLWWVDGTDFIGAAEIRPELATPLVAAYAGHVSMGVRPGKRGPGLRRQGPEMAKAVFGEASVMGVSRAMLVCRKDNPMAWRTLEHLGGIFMDEVPAVYAPGRHILRRYIIVTEPFLCYARHGVT
jgi:predicted acetyltransferase